MEAAVERFACTQCGKCCNRSPEVELSEAALLSDVFVFRLMFRLYWLPRNLSDYRELGDRHAEPDAAFYQKKRLLSAFAARKAPARIWRNGRSVEHISYLMISSLALDTSPGACSALQANRCGIYERRPLTCRSVPFHYSRAETLAGADLKRFVGAPGHACDTGETADVVFEAGRIVDANLVQARADALAIAERNRRWSEAIARRMKVGGSAYPCLPTIKEIELNAALGATTTSMRVAWQIAVDGGLMSADECASLTSQQLETIGRELARGSGDEDSRRTLVEMQSEYHNALQPVTRLTLDAMSALPTSLP